MSNITEILRARAAAVGNAKADGAIPGHKENPPEENPEKVAAVLSGAQGSTDVVATLAAPVEVIAFKVDEERAKAAQTVYKATHLRKYFLSNGATVRPTDGVYYAESEEQFANLQHFEKVGKVERITVEDKK